MNITEQKKNLRKIAKQNRAALSLDEVAEKSQEIAQNFIKEILVKILRENPRATFSLYISSYNEVETAILTDFFIRNNIPFSYPKITALGKELDFILVNKDTKLAPSSFFKEIIEPENGEKILPDVVIMPLLAFDDDLCRLGMGGGFFDRSIAFLKSQKSKIITIGLAYDIQRIDGKMPMENTDSSLDFIVTESQVFSAS